MCLFSYKSGDILWELHKKDSLKCRSNIIFINGINRFYGLCATLGANVLLGGYGDNKFVICSSLCGGGYS